MTCWSLLDPPTKTEVFHFFAFVFPDNWVLGLSGLGLLPCSAALQQSAWLLRFDHARLSFLSSLLLDTFACVVPLAKCCCGLSDSPRRLARCLQPLELPLLPPTLLLRRLQLLPQTLQLLLQLLNAPLLPCRVFRSVVVVAGDRCRVTTGVGHAPPGFWLLLLLLHHRVRGQRQTEREVDLWGEGILQGLRLSGRKDRRVLMLIIWLTS